MTESNDRGAVAQRGADNEPKREHSREDGRLPAGTHSAEAPGSGRNFVTPGMLPSDPNVLASAMADPAATALRVVAAAEGASSESFLTGYWAAFVSELRASSEKLRNGDLSHVEDMLMNQASALQAVFTKLMERGLSTKDKGTLDLLLRYGLRAQSQCRATLETLANVKNPPVVYARQANVTTGPQQVNNGVARASAESKSEMTPIKLSEGSHELRPHARTPALESRADRPLATVGAIDGTAHGHRQSEGRPQRLQGRHAPDAAQSRPRASRSRTQS